ncbi:VOC family protein [Actinocrispum sp. NPDC049592]|uniref:VOC family protein n=1 Tax=Actinocrispum sp. NPDC049592 TaxID=3154835 RepID=UPI00343251C4
MSGRVVHFEIPFDDGDRARGFYREAFGWDMMTMPDGEYTLVTVGPTSQETGPTEPGYINGGLTGRGTVTGPSLVIDVENIEDALAKIEAVGGKTVTGRTSVGDFGYSAYFNDTEGNLMGLWEARRG